MKRPTAWLMVAIVALFGGCCSKYPKEANRICVQGVDKQAVMDASQKVLENMHFTIEKADADAGYISTRPLPAQQFFEIWRSDTVGCQNFLEDNIHSVTRVAEINVIPKGYDFCIDCSVKARRLSMPPLDIASTSELPSVFSQGSVSVQSLRLRKEQKQAAAWIDMGPDKQLEAKILQKISKRLNDTGI
jgi:hypothetical protein